MSETHTKEEEEEESDAAAIVTPSLELVGPWRSRRPLTAADAARVQRAAGVQLRRAALFLRAKAVAAPPASNYVDLVQRTPLLAVCHAHATPALRVYFFPTPCLAPFVCVAAHAPGAHAWLAPPVADADTVAQLAAAVAAFKARHGVAGEAYVCPVPRALVSSADGTCDGVPVLCAIRVASAMTRALLPVWHALPLARMRDTLAPVRDAFAPPETSPLLAPVASRHWADCAAALLAQQPHSPSPASPPPAVADDEEGDEDGNNREPVYDVADDLSVVLRNGKGTSTTWPRATETDVRHVAARALAVLRAFDPFLAHVACVRVDRAAGAGDRAPPLRVCLALTARYAKALLRVAPGTPARPWRCVVYATDKAEPYAVATVFDDARGALLERLGRAHIADVAAALAAFAQHVARVAHCREGEDGEVLTGYTYTALAERRRAGACQRDEGSCSAVRAHSAAFHVKARIADRVLARAVPLFRYAPGMDPAALQEQFEPVRYSFGRRLRSWDDIRRALEREAER